MWRTTGRTSSCNFNYLYKIQADSTQHEKKKSTPKEQASATGGTAGCDALEATSTDHRPIIPDSKARRLDKCCHHLGHFLLRRDLGAVAFWETFELTQKDWRSSWQVFFVWSFPTQLHGKTSRTVNPCNFGAFATYDLRSGQRQLWLAADMVPPRKATVPQVLTRYFCKNLRSHAHANVHRLLPRTSTVRSVAGKDSRPVADVVRSTSHGSLPWPTYCSLEFMSQVRTLGICGPQQECTHPKCSVWAISVCLATKWSINKRKRKGSPPWHQIILKLMLLKN